MCTTRQGSSMPRSTRFLAMTLALTFVVQASVANESNAEPRSRQRLLYVAEPGIRDYLQWGGHGVLVYDIDHGHRFVKRISLEGYGVDENGKVLNVKGVCASAATGRLYVSTLRQLICVDLVTDQVLWQKTFALGCDRMSISPDGRIIYLPSFEGDVWYVVDAITGDEFKRLAPKSK